MSARVHPRAFFDLERDAPAHRTDREHGNAEEISGISA